MNEDSTMLRPQRYAIGDAPREAAHARDLQITITEVRGTSPTVAAGEEFLVRGEYVLSSDAIDYLVLSSLGSSRGDPAPLAEGAGTFEATAEILAVEAGRERVLDLVMIGLDGSDLDVHTRIVLQE